VPTRLTSIVRSKISGSPPSIGSWAAHVAGHGESAAVVGHLLELLALDPGDDDPRPALVQPPCRRGPDPPRGPRDEHPLAVERASAAGFVRTGKRVGFDPQAVDRQREHLVVTDAHAELDQLRLAEVAAELGPRFVGEVAAPMHVVRCPQQCALALAPLGR
jgi:hypothetical protein